MNNYQKKSIIDKIKSLVSNNKNLDDPKIMYKQDYEKRLNKEYGSCNTIDKKISLLIITDTHGTLNEDNFKEFLYNKYYDLCVMLGDHYDRDIEIILRNIDKNRLCGILGNHDYDYLAEYGIPNLNGKIVQVKGVTILGMQGSFKYKQVDFPSFTQEEGIKFFEDKPAVDVLLTHDKKLDPEKVNRDPAHQGLVGITRYIYKNRIPIHIHGHIHENYERIMPNGTKEISVFGYKIIEIGDKI